MKEVMGQKLHEILTQLMEECDIDDASLSRQTDIPASTLSRMRLVPGANPTAATLRPLAKFFDISISQLLGDEPLPKDRLPGTHNAVHLTSTLLPIIEWEAVPSWLENKTLPENTDVKWISSEQKLSEKAFALLIHTDTLGLFLRKGSLILIDPEQNPKDNDIILLKAVNNNMIFLRQLLMDGHHCYIRSVNPELKGIEIIDKNHILMGTLVEIRFNLQDSRSQNTPSMKWFRHPIVQRRVRNVQ